MTIDCTVATVAGGAGVSHSPGRTASWVRQYHGRPATERLYSAVLPLAPSPSARWIWGVTERYLAVKGGRRSRYRRCVVCVIPIRSLHIVFWAFQKTEEKCFELSVLCPVCCYGSVVLWCLSAVILLAPSRKRKSFGTLCLVLVKKKFLKFCLPQIPSTLIRGVPGLCLEANVSQ